MPASAQEKPPEFPSGVEVVTVDVVVKDKRGNPVSGLGRPEFTLLEDGRPQAITSFEEIAGSGPIETAGTEAAESSPSDTFAGNAGVAPRLRRTFVVIIDQVHLTSLQADRARRALQRFLTAGLREGDRVRLLAVGSWEFEGPVEEAVQKLSEVEGQRVPDQGPEAITDYEAMRINRFDDGPLLLRVLERIAILTVGRQPSGTGGESLPEVERIRNSVPQELGLSTRGGGGLDEGYVKTLAQRVYIEALHRNESTLLALESALYRLAAERGRKSVVLVSSGLVNDPNLDGFRRVVEASTLANAAIYFLDARGLEGIPGEAAEHGTLIPSIDLGLALTSQALESQGSEILAADTGGFTVKNRNDLESGFRQIAAETRSYYLLGYAPPPTRGEGEFRKIEVQVRRKGVEVRARKGYYAGARAATAIAAAKAGWESAGPIGDRSVEIPLRSASFVFGDAGDGKVRALVAAEADLASLALQDRDGFLQGSLDLVIVVTPQAGGEADRLVQQVDVRLTPERRKALEARGLPLAHTLDLPPGEYDARIALSDRIGGRVGATSLRFEVPAEGFRLSTPILSDVMEPGPEAGRDAPALGARRRFPQRGTLYFQFEVYGAKVDPATGRPAVVSGWAVRDKSGTEWAGSEPARLDTTEHRAPRRLGQVDLTFPPGDYTLVLDAKDQVSARRVEVREAFTVEARP